MDHSWHTFAHATERSDALDVKTGAEELILGIDLGTSNTAACCVVDGRPVMIDLRDEDDPRVGVRSIPSVVAFDDDTRATVGAKALAQLPVNARRTFVGTKRFIGRRYDSPIVQEMLSYFPYRVVPGDGGAVAVEINGRVKPLTAISAYLLAAVRDRAEKHLRRPLRKAVITVPAHYNDNQRSAVVSAGKLAGLEVIAVLSEPTAAAIAYGFTKRPNEPARTVLVYDLGGGTFDVSVMRIEGGQLRVLSTAGDTFLGGEDFDSRLLDDLIERYASAHGVQISRNNAAVAPLKQAVEAAKRRLSLHAETRIVCKDVVLADRSRVKLDMPLTRARLETLVAPLIAQTLAICDRAFQEAKLAPGALSEVILSGGQTLMPCVRSAVEKHFGLAPRCEINPDETVALGAGLMPLLRREAASFADAVPMSIGIAVGDVFHPVIAKDTAVPYRRDVRVKIAAAELAKTTLQICQGDSPRARANEALGTIPLGVVSPGRLDPVPISVTFSMSTDCRLSMIVTNEETAQRVPVFLDTIEPRRQASQPSATSS